MAFSSFCTAQNVLIANNNFYNKEEEYVLLSPAGKLIKSFQGIEIAMLHPYIVEGMICGRDAKTKKMGYLSAVTGEWAVPPQYEDKSEGFDFNEGIAIVERMVKDKKERGAIDKTGKIIVPFTDTWTDIKNFSEGLAIVSQSNNKIESCGVIDKTGKLVIPFSVGDIGDFKEGLATKKDEKGKIGYIDKTGNWVIKPQWEDAMPFSEGLALVSLKTEKAAFGYIDKTGKLVIKYEYEGIQYEGEVNPMSFKEGFAVVGVKVGTGDNAEIKQTFIDKTGKRLTKEVFDIAMPFQEGLAAVAIQKNDDLLYGFIDKTGKLVIPMVHEKSGGYDPIFGFKEGLCPTLKGYIDIKGNLVIGYKAGMGAATFFQNGLATLCIFEEKEDYFTYNLIDKTGKILWKSVENVSLCFPAGEYVTLANGSRKKIETFKKGDIVLDLNNTPSVVEAVEEHNGNFTIGALSFNMPEKVDFVANGVSQNTVILEATLNHPLSIGGKKVPLNDVKIGDTVLQLIDNQVIKTRVKTVNKKHRTVKVVYNLRTSGKGYFVNGYGVLNK